MAQECVTPDGLGLSAADDKTLPVDIPSDVLNKPPVYESDSESTSDDSVFLQQSEDTDDTQDTTSVESLPAPKRRRTEDEGVHDTTGVQDLPAAKRLKTESDVAQDSVIVVKPSAPKRPKIFCHSHFDIQALCRLASNLRDNMPCTCDINQRPQNGAFNWVVFIVFEDGVQWVMRSPYIGGYHAAAPMDFLSKSLDSEAATLRYLKEHSDIPVPDIYSYSTTRDNEVGIPYILMSKAQGVPLSQKWTANESISPEVAPENKAKILSQLGAFAFKLSQLRFDCVGSLFEQNGSFHIGECLSRGHVCHQRSELREIPRGPFTSETEFYDSLIQAFIQHGESLPLCLHCFIAPIPCREDYDTHEEYTAAVDLWNDFVGQGGKLESAENRRDYIIAGEALRELIPRWRQEVLTVHPNTFSLHHPDLSANNIYVDDDFNITCIIDWQFCSTVPDGMALIPPGLPQSRDELSGDLIAFFREGFDTAKSMYQKNTGAVEVQSLASSEATRCAWLLTRLLTHDSIHDFHLFSTVWEHVYGTQRDLSAYFLDKRSLLLDTGRFREMEEEEESPEEMCQEEEEEEEEEEDDDDEHDMNNILQESAAKYLSVISQWGAHGMTKSPRQFCRGDMFTTDSKLWKWMLKAIEARKKCLDVSSASIAV
ncbi:hypothetical protein KEM56_005904 [Ascosphaera pollenicola]|nr:hypothetical protein KEM56_005904 [Ascosphaera pollenicola]